MVSVDVWLDKFPEDKAEYYNKTRMSLELFTRKLNLSYMSVINDFRKHGYYYDSDRRLILPSSPRTKKCVILKFKYNAIFIYFLLQIS